MKDFRNVPAGTTGGALPPRVHAQAAPIDAEFWRDMTKRMARKVHGFVGCPIARALTWRIEEERDLFTILAADTSIDALEVFPEKLDLSIDGERREWVPAVRVRRGRQVAILDAMRGGEEGSSGRQRLNAALAEIYRSRRIGYKAFKRGDVLAKPRFQHALYVLDHRGTEPSSEDEFLVTQVLSKRPWMSIADLAREVAKPFVRHTAFDMGMRRKLQLDLNVPTPDEIRVALRPEP